MNEWQPMHEWPPPTGWPPAAGRTGLTATLRQRERSRSRVRLITVTVGAAALATAGVVAYQLPAPAHTTVSRTGTPAAQPSAVSQRSGDDGGGDDGSGAIAVQGGTSTLAPAHSTSGGS